MKENKWLKEVPLICLMACPFLVYCYLKPLLPELLPSHFTIDRNGEWVVDGRMSPWRLVMSMLLGCLLTYGSLSLAMFARRWQKSIQQQSLLLAPMMYTLKWGLILLFTAIPIYTMLVGAGKLTGGSATMWSYIGGILLLIMINLFVYRLYAVMYRYSEEKPLSRKAYMVIWMGTHIIVSIGPLCSLLAAGKLDAGRMIPQFVLVFLAICGNLMYNLRPNMYLGIRTPWTLKNETVWRKTHRLGGVMLFVFGVAGFIGTLLADAQQIHFILVAVVLISTLIPAVYSYIIYEKLIHQP